MYHVLYIKHTISDYGNHIYIYTILYKFLIILVLSWNTKVNVLHEPDSDSNSSINIFFCSHRNVYIM